MNTKKLIGTILGVILFAALIAGATFAWLSGDITVNNTQTLNTQVTQFLIDYTTGSAVTNLPVIDSHQAKPGTVEKTLNSQSTDPEKRKQGLSGAETPVTAITIKKPATSTTTNIPDAHAAIWLRTSTTNTLTKTGVVRWAICRDDLKSTLTTYTGCEGLTTSFEEEYYSDYPTNTQINANSKVLNMGKVTDDGIIALLSDARLADREDGKTIASVTADCTPTPKNKITTDHENGGPSTLQPSICTGTSSDKNKLTTEGVTYYVYFWLDGETITNEHLWEQYNEIDKTTQYQIGVSSKGPDITGGIKYDLYAGYVFASATQKQEPQPQQ